MAKRGRQGEGGGQPPKYKDEQSLKTRVDEYFATCLELKSRPSKAGLRVHLNISRPVYNEYKVKYPNTLKHAEDIIEVAWIERLDGNSPTGAIFYLKNAFKEEYKDRHETDVTTGGAPIQIAWQPVQKS